MYTLATLSLIVGASALVVPRSSYSFGLTASGGEAGTIGQLADGQNRIGGGLAAATFTISNGGIIDAAGRGCILTPSVEQFQCDQGASPTYGFAIESNGTLTSSGSSVFYACPASDTEWNLYTTPVIGQKKCVEITLTASACGAETTSSCAAPETVKTVTVYECGVAPSTSPAIIFSSTPASVPAESSATSIVPVVSASGIIVSSETVPATVVESTSPAPVVAESSTPATVVESTSPAPVVAESSTPATVVESTSPAPVAVESSPPATVVKSTSPAPVAVESSPPATVVKSSSPAPVVVESSTPATVVEYSSTAPVVVSSSKGITTSYHPHTMISPSSVMETSTKPVTVSPTTSITPEISPVTSATPTTTIYHTTAPYRNTTITTHSSIPSSTASSSASSISSSSSCVATTLTGSDTSGNYQYPHLIIPVSSTSPNTAYGTQYFATISSNVSTIFNFDIPSSYAGSTCNLIFLLPLQSELETSSYTYSGSGEIEFEQLSTAATSATTYNNAPSVKTGLGDFEITEGSSTLISSFSCPAGETVTYELKSLQDTYLYYFQDWNPSPIGLFITHC